MSRGCRMCQRSAHARTTHATNTQPAINPAGQNSLCANVGPPRHNVLVGTTVGIEVQVMSRRITLTFASVDCDRCGGRRLKTQPCAECGRLPLAHETQPDLERRVRAISQIRAAPARELASRPVPHSYDEAVDEVQGLVRNATRALDGLSRGTRSADVVSEALADLDARVAHWTGRQPRPYTNRARSLGRSLQLLRRGLDEFVLALGEPTMLAAQARERRGQDLIDHAVEELQKERQVSEAEALLNAPDALAAVGYSARTTAVDADTLEALDKRLQELAGRDESSHAVGLGLQLHLFRQLMLVVLDFEESLAVANAAEFEIGDLTAICQDPQWQARHGVVTAQFSSAVFNLARIDEANDLEAAGAAMQLVMQCRDGVIRHCLATILASNSHDGSSLMLRTAGSVIKQAARAYPALLLDDNLSEDLRHAGAHYDYDVVDDQFVARTQSGAEIRLDIDDFLDKVLGYVQTSISLLMAVIAAVAVQGIDLDLSRHTPERDLLGAMSLLAGYVGIQDASVRLDRPTLLLEGRGQVPDLTTVAAGLAAIAPDGVEWIKAELTQTDGAIRRWQAPVSAFRAFTLRTSATEDSVELLAYARLMSNIEIDEHPAWDEEMWAGVGVAVANGLAALDIRDQIRLMREVRTLALSNGCERVAYAATQVLRSLRHAPPTVVTVPPAFTRDRTQG